jgi:segregation and condensation protein B
MTDKDPSPKKKRRSRAAAIEEITDVASSETPVDSADINSELHEDFSLDDLGAAYAQALAEHDPEAFASVSPAQESGHSDEDTDLQDEKSHQHDPDSDDSYVTPIGIIEAALFVGHPDNQSMSEIRLASLMRDVSPEEVVEMIDQLNQSYRQQHQALRIIRDEQGYRMTISPEVESIRRSFLGKVREARLNQSAVEVLALVAYQPGITAQKVQDQRGRESASLLNQLVRRQLLEIRRTPTEGSSKLVPHYYPTERFLYLFGLQSLDDLPQVEETQS